MKTTIECATMAQLLTELSPRVKDSRKKEIEAAIHTLKKNYTEYDVYKNFDDGTPEQSAAYLILEWKNKLWSDEDILREWI